MEWHIGATRRITTEPSVYGGDAALCQITLTTCYYFYYKLYKGTGYSDTVAKAVRGIHKVCEISQEIQRVDGKHRSCGGRDVRYTES